jgi:hypothetical protein
VKHAAAILCLLALGACTVHLREALPDAPAAVAAAVRLCHWESSDHLHAQPQGSDKWHVWDDRGNADAYLNRYKNGDGTFVCVGL